MYLWIKTIHIISIISWMAGLLYLPRLFVYHTKISKENEEMHLTFLTMEKRLLRYIMMPAMIFSLASGLWLIWIIDGMAYGWVHTKLLFIMALFATHGFFVTCHKKFERKENSYSTRFYKILNEWPTLCMVIIVLLVVLKPF